MFAFYLFVRFLDNEETASLPFLPFQVDNLYLAISTYACRIFTFSLAVVLWRGRRMTQWR